MTHRRLEATAWRPAPHMGAAVLAIALLSGCMSPQEPLGLKLEVTDADALLGDGSHIRLRFTPAFTAGPGVEAGIAVPPGLQVVSGTTQFAGPLEAGKEETVDIVVRAAKAGTYIVRGWATGPRGCIGGGMSNTVAVEFNAEPGRVTTRTISPPDANARIEVRTHGNDASDLEIHVVSNETFTAIACIILDNPTADNPTSLTLKEGTTEWHGQVVKGDTEIFHIKVAAPADGNYVVRTGLMPHASVTSNGIESYVLLTARNGTLSLTPT